MSFIIFSCSLTYLATLVTDYYTHLLLGIQSVPHIGEVMDMAREVMEMVGEMMNMVGVTMDGVGGIREIMRGTNYIICA